MALYTPQGELVVVCPDARGWDLRAFDAPESGSHLADGGPLPSRRVPMHLLHTCATTGLACMQDGLGVTW